jgi:hypothetical protein
VGREGILVVLNVTRPPHSAQGDARLIHQVYYVRDELITEIRGFENRETAMRAIAAAL